MIAGYLVRKACYNILRQHEDKGLFVKEVFQPTLGKLEYEHKTVFLPEERSLIRTIVLGIIQNRFLLDYNISKVHAQKIKPFKLQTILRIATYQVWFLDSIPNYAAINTGVEIAKQEVGHKASQFTNAILQKLSKRTLAYMEGNSHKVYSTNFSYPMWIVKLWAKQIPSQDLPKILQAGNKSSSNWLRVNLKKKQVEYIRSQVEKITASLKTEYDTSSVCFKYTSSDFPYFCWNISSQKIIQSHLFQQGYIAFQDPSSHYVLPLLQYKKGHKILDLCSAPGGKAAALVEFYNIQEPVYCSDLSSKRIMSIQDNQKRLGHTNLLPFVSNGIEPSAKPVFDTVLIDAPCSNLGVLARRPEARWRSEKELESLTSIQLRLLRSASKLVHKHGAIVYATCSPTTKETWDVIQVFLKEHPNWELSPVKDRIPEPLIRKGCLWTYPGEERSDGFFAARLQKKKFKEAST
jgi:16S rRNA (cytosine967-C5)-methyltransferase